MGKASATKGRILERAIRLSSLVGLDGLTIGRLATELSLSKSGLYAHFSSKEGLQIEVLRAAADEFIRDVVEPALKLPRGEARVLALFEYWMQWSLGGALPGGCIFVAAAVELDDQEGPVRDVLVDYQRAWIGALARAVRIAQEEAHYRADLDADQVAFEVHGIMLSFHHKARLLREDDAPARARTAFARIASDARSDGQFNPYSELLRRSGVPSRLN